MKLTKKPLALLIAAAAMTSGQAYAQWAIEEVVVTAQKRAQNLNDVGISVNAFTGENMKELGIRSAADMAQHTPGMTLSESAPTGVPVYSIRGMGFDDYTVGSSSTVGVYVNEVALPYPAMTTGQMYDIERVEVLKGVQGTLFGRNSTAGTINIVTAKPSDEFEGNIGIDYSNHGKTKVDGSVTGGLSDSVQGRLAFTTSNGGAGIQKHVTTGEELGDDDKYGIRGMLNIDASDDLSILLSASTSKDKSDSWGVLGEADVFGALTPAPANELGAKTRKDPEATAWSTKPLLNQESTAVSATVNWDISDSVTLTTVSSYDKFERDNQGDWDGTSTGNLDFANISTIESYTQEVRLSGDTDSMNWVAGLYASTDSVEENFLALGLLDSSGSFGMFDTLSNRNEQDTDTQAVFGQVEFNLSDTLKLTAGARYTREDQSFVGCTYDVDGGLADVVNIFFNGTYPDTIYTDAGVQPAQGDCISVDFNDNIYAPGNTSGAYFGTSKPFVSSLKTENISGKIALDWTPSDDVLVYASIGTGFKSGGHNGAFAFAHAQLAPYGEEEVLAYEAGFKTTLADSTVQLNGSVFYYDYRDKQILDVVPTFFGPLTTTVNVPKSEITGAELELQVRPVEGLDIKLGLAYLDTEVKDYVGFTVLNTGDMNGQVDYGALGAELPNSAKLQGNGLISYEFGVTDGLLLRSVVDFSYTDSYRNLLEDNALWVVDSYTLANARVALVEESGEWEVAAWVRNIGDKYYTPSNSYSNDIVSVTAGAGRTYGISANYNF